MSGKRKFAPQPESEGEIMSLSQIRNAIEVLERRLSRELPTHPVRHVVPFLAYKAPMTGGEILGW